MSIGLGFKKWDSLVGGSLLFWQAGLAVPNYVLVASEVIYPPVRQVSQSTSLPILHSMPSCGSWHAWHSGYPWHSTAGILLGLQSQLKSCIIV